MNLPVAAVQGHDAVNIDEMEHTDALIIVDEILTLVYVWQLSWGVFKRHRCAHMVRSMHV